MHKLLVLLIPLVLVFSGPAVDAGIMVFVADLTGPAEDPPNASPGFGTARVDFDTTAHAMRVRAVFESLSSETTVAHIHAATTGAGTGTAGVATPTPTFPGFPAGVTSGSYDMTFDMTLASSYRGGFITANGGTPGTAETALLQALNDGKAYLNIHTVEFPGGEIRGFFTAVPEPSHFVVLAAFAAGAVLWRRSGTCRVGDRTEA